MRRPAAVLVALALVSCAPAAKPAIRTTHTPAPSSPSATQPAPRPVVVSRFGATAGLLSVEIENPNAHVGVVRTGFTLKAFGANGTLLGRGGSGRVGDRCCTVFALPPLGHHGLFAELGPYAARVTRVEVTLTEPRWVPWADSTTPVVTATNAHLVATDPARVVTTISANVPAKASVQAFLEAPDGSLVAVVSALVGCALAKPHDVALDLFRRVPPGTRVGGVVAVPAGPAC